MEGRQEWSLKRGRAKGDRERERERRNQSSQLSNDSLPEERRASRVTRPPISDRQVFRSPTWPSLKRVARGGRARLLQGQRIRGRGCLPTLLHVTGTWPVDVAVGARSKR